ncbi:MAG: hypothetical protein SFZ03_03840 [Candidatus Melainabacteria bacterium]|nr:hypothetical protein [Candidatus Melainabacteria bacterium]
MTEDELNQMLDGQELLKTMDVKTLVVDVVRQMNDEEILDIFWKKLPTLNAQEVRGYFYMKRM